MPTRKRKAVRPQNEVSLKTELRASSERAANPKGTMSNFLRRQPVWILLAVASGGAAALNGVFAKLTTTQLTSTFARSIANLLSLSPDNKFIEFGIRAAFFGLNLLFNVIMWGLFTAALTRGSSTTRVSIVNVSANFMLTALLGLVIFSEKLPPLWWVGAGLLAGGNVVIGRREEGEKPGGTVGLDETRAEAEALLHAEEQEDSVELVEGVADAGGEYRTEEDLKRLRRGVDVDDPI